MRVYTRDMSECYCIVLRRASRRLTAIYDEALLPVGVNVAQYSLLQHIGGKGPLSLTELGRLTELDRSTIGRNVKVLQRMGLVRGADGDDQREAMVRLSPAGDRLLAAALPLWEGAQAKVREVLGSEAAGHLNTLLAGL